MYSVYVKSGAVLNEDDSWAELGRLTDVLDSNPLVLGCSAARQSDGASFHISVEAADVATAAKLASQAASEALSALSLSDHTDARLVFDADGNVIDTW